MSKSTITDDLRSQLASLEGSQTELIAERDEISYLAIVEKQSHPVKRLAEINSELANITSHAAGLAAALREAGSREAKAHEAAVAAKRCADARKADVLVSEAEHLAGALDAAMEAVRDGAVAFESKMIEIRRLTSVGPQYDHVRAFMFRSLRTALHRGPLHVDAIPIGDQTTMQQASASWAKSIRGWIAGVLDKTAAEKAA